MVYWLDLLLSNYVVEAIFNEFEVALPSQFVPPGILVSRIAADLAGKFISCSSKTADDIRLNGVKYVVAVAKACKLSAKINVNGALLANAVSCTHEFAEKTLRLIEQGREEELLK